MTTDLYVKSLFSHTHLSYGFCVDPVGSCSDYRCFYWGWDDFRSYDKMGNCKARVNLPEEIGYCWTEINSY